MPAGLHVLSPPPMNKQQWHITDLIDLEFFLGQDEGEDLDVLAARDREIHSRLAATATNTQSAPSSLLYGWLADRRKTAATSSPGTTLPGQVWQELFFLFFWGSLLLGLISGGTLAFSFLSYSGTRPVNVSAYFGIFVLLQVGLFLLLGVLSLYRKLLGKGLESSFFYRFLRRFFIRVMEMINRRAGSAISADTRLQWAGQLRSVSQLQQRYGTMFTRPFFLLAQIFGVSFNTGVFAATLMKVIGADVAFGWQTTLQVNAESIQTMVRWISAPWAWLLSDNCCPSLEQIKGSQLFLKEGIYPLTTDALVSWWPFLCLAVICYGLLPRLLLLIGSSVRQQRDLAGLQFDHGRYRRLIHRMRTPLFSTHAKAEPQKAKDSILPAKKPVKKQPPKPLRELAKEKPENKVKEAKKLKELPKKQPLVIDKPVTTTTSAPEQPAKLHIDPQPEIAVPEIAIPARVAMIPDELFADCPRTGLEKQVKARLGYEITTTLPFWTMEQDEEEELAVLRAQMTMDDSEDVLLLQEAWQPPIQELLSFLELLRQTIGDQASIIIALVGKPNQDVILTRVLKRDLQTWQQKINTLADPGLQLVELIK